MSEFITLTQQLTHELITVRASAIFVFHQVKDNHGAQTRVFILGSSRYWDVLETTDQIRRLLGITR